MNETKENPLANSLMINNHPQCHVRKVTNYQGLIIINIKAYILNIISNFGF